jgi:predicted extracellular nuclease
MENLPTLQALAATVNADAVAAGVANPNYRAVLEEGNDIGGIDVGFLVRMDRVRIEEAVQLGKTATYINPATKVPEMLNDRPSLSLRAVVSVRGAEPYAVTIIVNHLRSLTSIDDPVSGDRVRTKRRAQAEYLANQVQALQSAKPREPIVLVGDFNAFAFNDGYVDVLGTLLGRPAPASQVVLASPDLVKPDLINVATTLMPREQYSYVFAGNAQELDHVIVNDDAHAAFSRLEYVRNDADFPQSYRSDPDRPERVSDHDPVVAYFAAPGTRRTAPERR